MAILKGRQSDLTMPHPLFLLCHVLLLSPLSTTSFSQKPTHSFINTRLRMSAKERQPSPPILVVGLNPALQKRFHLPSLTPVTPGGVHRATHIEYGMGGKGQNVAFALSFLASSPSASSPSYCSLLQFLGAGANGDQVLALETDKFRDTVSPLTVRTRLETRLCTTIVSDEDATELVEPSGDVSPEEVGGVLKLVGDEFPDGVRACCIMGSMPPQCPPKTYADIVHRSSPRLLLVDTVIGLEVLFRELSAGEPKITTMLKINLDELAGLAGLPLASKTREGISALVSAFMKTYEVKRSALPFIAITDGKDPAYFVRVRDEQTSVWRMDIVHPCPNGDARLYPIGAGDAVAAGTIAAWNAIQTGDGMPLKDEVRDGLRPYMDGGEAHDVPTEATAFGFGLSCGGASCLEVDNSVLGIDNVLRIFEGMTQRGWELLE